MSENTPIPFSGNASPFDAIRRTRPDGSEYWSARELMPLMGYAQWRDFQTAIERAKVSAGNTGMDVESNFARVRKVAGQSPNPREDYELSRQAAYLVSLNGDPSKPESAASQAYFVAKTREAETAPALTSLDLIIATATELKRVEQQAALADAKADRALARIEAITPTQADEIYYSARAWARVNDADGSKKFLHRLGIKAGQLGRAAGLTPDRIPDRENGIVNGWPLWVWDNAFDAIENGVSGVSK